MLIETFNGLDDEGVDDLFIIVPVETLILENGVEFVVLLDECFIELTPQLAISIVAVLCTIHVILINLTLFNLLEELTNKSCRVVPANLLGTQKIVQLFILAQLQGEAVEYKFSRRVGLSFTRCPGLNKFQTASGLLSNGYDES